MKNFGTEPLCRLIVGCRMNVLQVEDVGVGVDTPEDILKVEAILALGRN